MPIKHEEIIEDLEDNMKRFGGERGDWCVGTAKDFRGPFFQRHREADLGDGLAYREAFTTDASQTVLAHLVNNRGLAFDSDSVPDAGKIVFIYHKPVSAHPAQHGDQATFHSSFRQGSRRQFDLALRRTWTLLNGPRQLWFVFKRLLHGQFI